MNGIFLEGFPDNNQIPLPGGIYIRSGAISAQQQVLCSIALKNAYMRLQAGSIDFSIASGQAFALCTAYEAPRLR